MEFIYNYDYFLNKCDGFKTFKSSNGFHLSKRHSRIIKRIIKLPFKRILDIGCGRGELSLNLAIRGFEVYGCDFSNDAINIALNMRKYWLSKKRNLKLNFFLADAKKLPFDNSFFDAVVLIDVIEHIRYDEVVKIFEECRRVLTPSGKIFIHTSPGKIFLNYGLLIYRLVGFFMGYRFDKGLNELLPQELRFPYHLNEWSSFMLKRSLKKCGFSDISIELWKNPHYAYYFTSDDRFLKVISFISKVIPWSELFYADIFVSATKDKN